jgi:F-type H+-transporting ATPase subunit delta
LSDPRVAALVSSPRLQAKDRVALLLPAGETAGSAFALYLSALADNGRLSLLPQALLEFEQLRAEAERTLAVTVRSALPIDSGQQAQLIEKLSKRFNRSVALNIVLEPGLIGGAVIDAGSIVIDGSLSGKLRRMHTDLAA